MTSTRFHIPHPRPIVALLVAALVGCSSTHTTSDPSAAPAPTPPEALATTPEPTSSNPPATTQPATTAPATTVPATTVPATTALPTSTLPGALGLYPPPIAGDLPSGVYTVDITDEDLTKLGDTNLAENHGHYEWTFDAGIWSFVQTADNPLQNPMGTGTYQAAGDHVKFYGGSDDPGQDFVWAENADGSLQLTYQASTNRFWSAALGSHPLVLAP